MTYIDELNKAKTWDYEVHSFDGDSLIIVASQDFTYGAQVRITISGICYMDCPFQFSHPHFREMSLAEQDSVGEKIGTITKVGVKLCINCTPDRAFVESDFYIVARSVVVEILK